MAPQVLISISQLSHVYAGTRRKTGHRALQEVDLDIHSGETMALLGPNGSGKSTLLRVLTTALVPTSGAVRVGGKLLGQDPAAVRRQLGVVFQNPALDGKMTVGENLRMAGLLYGMSRRVVRERSQQLLEVVGLWERRNERVEKLSGGMRRRVELAKALLPAPAILVLDEPTTGLDPVARQDFWRQVEAIKANEQLTVVVSTHLLDEAERADRVAILHQGELLVCGPPRALQRQLGREILTLRSDNATALQAALRSAMGLEGQVVDQDLRVPLRSDISLDEVFQRFGSQIPLAVAGPSFARRCVRAPHRPTPRGRGRCLNGVWILAQREVLRFLRQPSRLLGSLVQPLMLWFFMGSGFADSFISRSSELSYGEFFYPGIVLMLLLFAAIFSTITLIEDRSFGFLQGVLVAPVPRLSIALGKLVGGTLIALLQVVVFLLLAPVAGIGLAAEMILALLALCALIGMGFTGLGFMVAWKLDSVAGYHSVMSVVLIPLWFLSGALFPIEGAAPWLEWVMQCNPVTYALVVLRKAFYLVPTQLIADGAFVHALLITSGWTVLTTVGAAWMVARNRGP